MNSSRFVKLMGAAAVLLVTILLVKNNLPGLRSNRIIFSTVKTSTVRKIPEEYQPPFQRKPDAPSVKYQCINNKVKTVFFVHSSLYHVKHRSILRETIMQSEEATIHNWTMVFFIGMPRDATLRRSIIQESILYGDIAVLPFIDTYRNLSYKFIYGAKWVIENCKSAHYVVKIDDDVFVNIYNVIEYIRNNITEKDRRFHCRRWITMGVIRSTNSPWYISKKLYPSKFFPPYCSGAAMIFSANLLEPLYSASLHLPYLPIDDVYVTGDLAVIAKIGHKDLAKLITFDQKLSNELTKGRHLFGHFPGENNFKVRLALWEKMTEFHKTTITNENYGTIQAAV